MNKMLLGAAVVFGGMLVAVVLTRGQGEKVGVKELKVGAIDTAKLTRIEVSWPQPAPAAAPAADGAAAADAPKEVKKSVLEKSGAEWKVHDPASPEKKFVVDKTAIDGLLEAVGDLAATDLIANKPAQHEGLEVDDARGLRVTLRSGGSVDADLLFGRSVKGGGTALRQAGADEVFVTKGRLGALAKKDVTAWRKKVMFEAKAEDFTRIEVKRADGQAYTLVANSAPAPAPAEGDDGPPTAPKTTWTLADTTLPDGFRLDEAALARTASSLSSLRAVEFADGVADDVTGLGGAHTVITAQQKSGSPLVLHLGKEDDKKRVYARVDGDAQTYLVANFNAKTLGRSLDELRLMTLMKGQADDVTRAVFKGSAGSIVVAKKDGAWSLLEPKTAPEGFDAAQIGAAVAAVLNVRAARYVGAVDDKAAGLNPGAPSVELTFQDGKKQLLRFGAPAPGADGAAPADPPREFYAAGGADGGVYVVTAFVRGRYDKPAELFKTPAAPPDGMGGMPRMGGMPGGGISGMDQLPPELRKQLEESLKNRGQ